MGLRSWLRASRAHLAERPARIGIVVAAALAGVGVGVPVSDNAYDYSWRSPHFCDDCHVHDYANEAYFRSVHAGVTTCHDCHLVPIIHYPRNMWMMVADRPQTPDDIGLPHVGSVLCEACHTRQEEVEFTGPMTDELRARVVKIDDSPLHKVHLEATERTPGAYLGGQPEEDGGHEGEDGGHGDEGGEHGAEGGEHGGGGHGAETRVIACIDCHGSGGNEESHRFTATRENCLECHGGLDVHAGRLGELRCQECHFQGFTGE